MSTLSTVNNLGLLYSGQGKLKEAEEMYQRVLVGYKKNLGIDYTSILNTVYNLGLLYSNQGNLKKRAPVGYKKALDPDYDKIRRLVDMLNVLSIADRKQQPFIPYKV